MQLKGRFKFTGKWFMLANSSSNQEAVHCITASEKSDIIQRYLMLVRNQNEWRLALLGADSTPFSLSET